MSDIGETWSGYKEQRKAKRDKNRESAHEILGNRGIDYDAKNGGAHFIVYGESETIDFWPGTGKFIARTSKVSGRGIFNMIRHLRQGKK